MPVPFVSLEVAAQVDNAKDPVPGLVLDLVHTDEPVNPVCIRMMLNMIREDFILREFSYINNYCLFPKFVSYYKSLSYSKSIPKIVLRKISLLFVRVYL